MEPLSTVSPNHSHAQVQQISDISPMKIRYWDNSVLVMNGEYHVAIKCPTGISFDWHTTENEGEKFVASLSRSEEAETAWGTLMVLNPYDYINISLYFRGHFDNDLLLKTCLK